LKWAAIALLASLPGRALAGGEATASADDEPAPVELDGAGWYVFQLEGQYAFEFGEGQYVVELLPDTNALADTGIHAVVDLSGGGYYVIDVGAGESYLETDLVLQPVVTPRDRRSRYIVWLVGGGLDNIFYLADGQYCDLLLPEGAGGLHSIEYVTWGGGGSYGLFVTPWGGGGSFGLYAGGGSFGLYAVPLGDGGQYIVHTIPTSH
jgi:hypothetical protein